MEIRLVLRSQTFIHLSGSGRGGAWHIGLALPAMPHHANSAVVSVPLVEPVIRRTLGMIRVKNRPLSAAAERFASLLLLMWTDEARELWCNVVDSHQQL